MDNAFKLIGQSVLVAAAIIMILFVTLDLARAAEVDYNDCLYQRMVTAAAYTALDDAEQENLPRAVIQNLEIDLATAVEMEHYVCRGN